MGENSYKTMKLCRVIPELKKVNTLQWKSDVVYVPVTFQLIKKYCKILPTLYSFFGVQIYFFQWMKRSFDKKVLFCVCHIHATLFRSSI